MQTEYLIKNISLYPYKPSLNQTARIRKLS